MLRSAAGSTATLAFAAALTMTQPSLPAQAASDPQVYALTVAGPVVPPGGGATGFADFSRVRLMVAPTVAGVAIDLAYEHTLLALGSPSDGLGALVPGATRASGDWLGLDGTIRSDQRIDWRQRVDRLSATLRSGDFTVSAGRQPISWATTLFLTPADPFAPFVPSDPFREYRAGVDAVRGRWFPGPFTEAEAVVRPARTPDGRTVTALARGRLKRGAWDLSMWAGALHDRAAAAAGAVVTAGGSAFRIEGALRGTEEGVARVRAAASVDRRVTFLGHDLYGVIELQHDGFGAARAADLTSVAGSLTARRGEMQVLGRDETAVQAQWQVHPLATLEAVAIVNLRDGSILWAPGLVLSATGSITVRLGGDLGTGARDADPGRPPASEYGAVPRFGYIAVSAFL